MGQQKQAGFPAFSLSRLLETVFAPKPGEVITLIIDLPDPKKAINFDFTNERRDTPQNYAYDVFYRGLHDGVLAELGLKGGALFAYQETGGSNLDLPERAYSTDGREVSLLNDVCAKSDIVMCISSYSATAPLTAWAKQAGFRGATLHGVNKIILESGLAVDYNEVSKAAEKLRLGMTKADAVEIDFQFDGRTETLRLELGKQEAQKSHGLCRVGPDIANLPAGEVYFVPTDAKGAFPYVYEDKTIGLLRVRDNKVVDGELLEGSQATVAEHIEKIKSDPAVGWIGELGFGTQVLPVSGRDIQDEKILGTLHVATGRSDHLGGNITPANFKVKKNATHDDILFAPHKTPKIKIRARMFRDGREELLIENYQPAAYLQSLMR